jgi:hypothetical protein
MVNSSAVKAVADNLKSHPVALAFIVIIVVFQAAQVWILRDVAHNNRERFNAQDKLLATISEQCFRRDK